MQKFQPRNTIFFFQKLITLIMVKNDIDVDEIPGKYAKVIIRMISKTKKGKKKHLKNSKLIFHRDICICMLIFPLPARVRK